jgi:hypothetical protein
MKTTKAIAVVYDNAQARHTAIRFCDGLVSRFWEQFEFEISWWSFHQLDRVDSGDEAAKKAGTADLVVFATSGGRWVSPSFEKWVELWLPEREAHEGVLVSLSSARASTDLAASAMSPYLRSLAHRAGMDYLTEMPEGLSHLIPESVDSCAERAQRVTTLLDEILHSPLPAAPAPLA